MAIMIPNLISDTKSDAEKNVFRWLKNDPKTNGWVVLHSYPLFHHETLIVGEADFIVIAPNLGIFALEVKGGLVERKEGAWYFTGRQGISGPKKRGPFEQAEESIQSIMALIKKKYGANSHLGRLTFGYGCVFPDMLFDYSSPEFEKAIIFDERNNGQIGKFIMSLSKYWVNRFEQTYGFSSADKLPTKEDVTELSYFLRPNFEDLTPLRTIFHSSEKQIEKLTNEQYQIIDCLEDNKRSIIIGSAGTGKTLLGVQSFLKSAEKGCKVGFFCFNRLLGNFIKNNVPNSLIENGSFAGTIHSFIISYLKKKDVNFSIPDVNTDYFYKHELLERFIEVVSNDFEFEPFDMVVIDEAQDLLADEYILVFDSILKDGFSRGSWQMFADFENQDINADYHLSEPEAKEKVGNPASFRLTINCRNTFQICKEIENVADVKYKNIINQITGQPVDHIEYSSSEEGTKLLDEKLDELLKNNKIDNSDIIILSPKKKENSIAAQSKHKIVDYDVGGSAKQCIEFSTIQAFKGLEKAIVFLVDVESYSIDKLLYVGLSRAKAGLFVFETPAAHTERIKIVVGKKNG